MKRRIIAFMTALLMLCSLSSCAKTIEENSSPKYVLTEALKTVGMTDRGICYYSETDDDAEKLDDDILSGKYGELLDAPTTDMFVSYAAFFSYDAYGVEIGVFKMKDKAAADKMKTYIENRQRRLLENAVNYPDVDTAIVKSLETFTDGAWLWYVMSESNEKVTASIENNLYGG